MKQAMQRQRGIGLLGLLFFLGLIVFCVTVAVKLGPHYMEYFTIRSVMKDLTEDPSLPKQGKQRISRTIEDRLYVNAVDTVTAKDFKYKKTDGGYGISLNYEVREHLFGNVAAVLTFQHQVQVGSK